MASEAQRKAVKNYKKKINRFTVDFYPADNDLWEQLQKQPNKQGYIKNLIRQDIKKGGA